MADFHQANRDRNISNTEQFEALFNHATIGIIITNDAGEIVNFNKLAKNQFGYSKEELPGKKVEALLPPSDISCCIYNYLEHKSRMYPSQHT